MMRKAKNTKKMICAIPALAPAIPAKSKCSSDDRHDKKNERPIQHIILLLPSAKPQPVFIPKKNDKTGIKFPRFSKIVGRCLRNAVRAS